MGEGLARAITIGSIVFTIASLGVAVLFARKASRVRVGFDVARAAVGVIAILVMAAITNVTTPLFAIVLAIIGGLALGFGQGSNLEVTSSERGFFSKRNPIGIALWGAGIVVMQAAGIASRTGMVKIGQTIAWFSVCLGVGLLVGRTSPLRGARQAIAGGGAAMLLVVLALPATTLIGGATTAAAAQTIQLTDDEVCDLIPTYESAYPDLPGHYEPGMAIQARGDANCIFGVTLSEQDVLSISVALFASADAARNLLAVAPTDDSAPGGVGSATSLDIGEAARHWSWVQPSECCGNAQLSVTKAVIGPFLIFANGNGPGVDTITAARDTATRLTAVIPTASPSPPPVEDVAPDQDETTTSAGVVEPDADSTSVIEDTRQEQDTALPPVTDGSADDPIEPEEAAGQAVAGLIAAAAIGLITLGEASGEIGRILGGMGGGGSTTAPPQEPFIDPYDQKPLETDPETGMVWWPWDGGEGQWVDAAVVPGLLDEWNRELDAETARRVGRHNAQRERNWADLKDRIRRSEAEDAARIAAEQARFDDFDRRIEAARGWMEQDDAASLPELDQIMQRVADQGFVTDADRARATQILDRTQAYSTALQQRDAEDWARIINNRVAVPEMAAKGVSILLDPTRGFISGAIWGWVEAGYDGQGLAGCAGNAAKNSLITGAFVNIGMWGPGQAAMGPLAWGVSSGSILAAGETLARGGSLEDARNAMPTGFVFGGLGGMAGKASTIGLRQPAQLPKITSGPGGTRTGYSPPPRPSLAPPTRGSIGAGSSSVPVIRVQPDGPTVDFDQPLSPRGAGSQATEGGGSTPVIRVKPGGSTVGHDYPLSPKHIDAQDPRYHPPGTPAEDIPMPPSDWSHPPQPIPEQVGPPTGTGGGRIDLPEPQAPVAPRPAADLPEAPPAAPTTPRAPTDVPEQYGPPRFGDTPEPPPPPTIKEPPILDPDILTEGPKTTPPPKPPTGLDDGGVNVGRVDPAGPDAIPDGWPTETGPAPRGPDQFVDLPDGPPTPPRIDFDESPVPGMAPRSSPTAGLDDGGTIATPRPAADLPEAPAAAPTTPAAPRPAADVPEQYGPPRFSDAPEPPPPPAIKDPPILDPEGTTGGFEPTPPPKPPAGLDEGATINLTDFPEAPRGGPDAMPDSWPGEIGTPRPGRAQIIGPPEPQAPTTARPPVDLPEAPPAAPTTPAAPRPAADVPEQYGPPRFSDAPEPPPPPAIKDPPILDPEGTTGGSRATPIDGPEPAVTRPGADVPESAPPAAADAPEPPAAGRPPADAPETLTPAARDEIARGARPTKRGGELVDEMMNQPEPSTGSRPATKPAGLQDWQRGAFPDADGRPLWDAEGRILVPDKNPSGARVGDRNIGRVDPETGALQNLDGDPIQVTVDHRGVPNGYVEMPDVPPGRAPIYNERGEFVGHVDKLGRAEIGGESVPVAIDARGNLVPRDAPGPAPPLADLDTAPRIPVLDEGGQVAHFVEPGPREIRYNADGTPHFVQRQHPVESTPMKGIPVDPRNPPPDLGTMPTPEVFDMTEAWFPLTGKGAPPRAPDVVYPTTPGGDPA